MVHSFGYMKQFSHFETFSAAIALWNFNTKNHTENFRVTLKIHENCPRQRNWVTLKIFQRYFSAFSVLSLLPIMSTEIHLNHLKWFSTWLHYKTAQYFFSVISSFSVWLTKCKDQYLNNKDKFSVWFSVFFQCLFLSAVLLY